MADGVPTAFETWLISGSFGSLDIKVSIAAGFFLFSGKAFCFGVRCSATTATASKGSVGGTSSPSTGGSLIEESLGSVSAVSSAPPGSSSVASCSSATCSTFVDASATC